MKKLFSLKTIFIITIIGLLFTVNTAYAGWTLEANPITGIFKATGATIYHVIETPALILAGEKSILEVGDVTRGPIEGIEEIGSGFAGINTGTITDVGKINTVIESNWLSHGLRNGIGTGIAVSSIVSGSSSALHATQAGVWTGAAVTVIDSANYYTEH